VEQEATLVRQAIGQVSLVEARLPAAFGSKQRLERIRAQVDGQPIEALLQPVRRAPTGRPAYPPLVPLKALLHQQWYRLSDRDLEEAPAHRRSFRRFCGLGLEDAVPDAATLSRFRIDLAEAVVAALNVQIEQLFGTMRRRYLYRRVRYRSLERNRCQLCTAMNLPSADQITG